MANDPGTGTPDPDADPPARRPVLIEDEAQVHPGDRAVSAHEVEALMAGDRPAEPRPIDMHPDADPVADPVSEAEIQEILDAERALDETGAAAPGDPDPLIAPVAEPVDEPVAARLHHPEPDPEPDPVTAAAPMAAVQADPVQDTEHRSIAGRILTYLVILILGAAAALWAAPRLAPNLPAGLAPVAAWLTPGAADQAAALAALRAEMEGKIAAIRPGLTSEDVQALVAERVGALPPPAQPDPALAAQVQALADQLAASDSTAVEARLAQAEASLNGLTAELAALTNALAAGPAPDGGTPALSADAVAQVAALSATVEGLKGEIAAIAGQTGTLSQRIDEVEAASLRRETASAEAASAATASADAVREDATLTATLTDLTARLTSGQPYAVPLAEAARLRGVEPPAPLAARAETGIPTGTALRAAFPPLAHDAIRASIRAGSGDGLVGRAAGFFEAQVAGRSLTPRQGSDTDAVLSRVDAALTAENYDAALVEAAALPPEAAAVLQGWLADLTARRDALVALADFAAAPTN